MIIEVKNKESAVPFSSIEQGSSFKCIGDFDRIAYYYVKTNSLTFNAMKIDTGAMYEFRPDDMVIPVNGKFVVE